jgi:hypothetical protein
MKARISKSVVVGNGVKPLAEAKNSKRNWIKIYH